MARKVEKTERYLNTRHAGLTGLLLLCGLLLTLAPTARAQTATSTPAATLTVTTLTDDAKTPAPGSLRYQVNRAKAMSTSTTIIFDPALSGGTITPTRRLELSGNIHLLAQDAAGMSIGMTLDGSRLPAGNDVLTISSNTATVSGFDIVNFADAGIAVSGSWRCPAKARVTISDNVLIVATSTAVGIEVGSGTRRCSAVTISENRIAADTSEPESRGAGIYITVEGFSARAAATVSGNTITGAGIRFENAGDGGTNEMTATVSGNTITGAGIRFENTGGRGIYRLKATVSGNTITGAGIHFEDDARRGVFPYDYDPGHRRLKATVSGNTITGAGIHFEDYLRGGLTATVSGNTTTGAGIHFENKYGGTNATVSGNTTTGIRFEGSLFSGWVTATVSGNTTTSTGIHFVNRSGSGSNRLKATVSANTITGTGISYENRGGGGGQRITATVSSNTITGTGTGIAFEDRAGGGGHRITATVSGNTITGTGTGIAYDNRGGGGGHTVTATVSGNTITGTGTGIAYRNRSGGGGQRMTATVSSNTITGARYGIRITNGGGGGGNRLTVRGSDNTIIGSGMYGIQLVGGNGGDKRLTVRGSGNTVIGSGTADIFALTSRWSSTAVSGRLENTIFNTKSVVGGSFTVHRYQAATLPSGGLTGGYRNQDGTTEVVTIPTIEETYLSAPAQVAPRQAVERAVAVVSRQATSTDFGATPLVVRLIPRDADGRVVSGVADHPVRVCLPLPAGLSDAPTPQLAWLDGPVWHLLSSERSEGQICADFRGFPLFLGSTGVPDTPDNPGGPGNPGGGTTNPGGPGNPAPPQHQAADAEATARGTESAGSSAPLAGHPPLVGVLENPRPASSQSGIGLISGWVCAGAVVELEVDGTPLGAAASGTSRADVAATGACGGRADVGFGLLFNWNLLGDGQHTIRALADGVEFSQATFTVTTLGEEFVHEGSGTALVADFPSPGEQARLVWQAGLQNFMLAPLSAPAARPAGGLAPAPAGGPLGVLENPAGGSFQSGLSVLSGWVCEATVVEVELNGDSAHRLAAAYGTGRADTADACGNAGSNGFGLLFNWNLLGDGVHTVRVLADGVEFGRATFTVTTFGEEFVREARGRVVVADFPSPGETAMLAWQEATQTFVITHLE